MDVIEALAPRSFTTHFKDMGLDEYREGFLLAEVPLGSGVLDLPRAVRILRAARPEIRFNIEMITRDPLRVPCLAQKYWATFPDLPGRHLARTLSPGPRASPEPPVASHQPDDRATSSSGRRTRTSAPAWPSHAIGSGCSMGPDPARVARRGARPLEPLDPGGHHERARLERRGRGDGSIHVAENLPGQPRGAIAGRQARVSVVFGNESGRDPAAVQDEVARIRESLDEEGIRVLGFAAAPGDGETWAMIVESEDLALLDELVGGLAD